MITLRDILCMPGAKGVDIDDTSISLENKIPFYYNKIFDDELHKLHRKFTDADYVWLGLDKLKISEEANITHEDILMMLKRMEQDRIIETIMPKPYCIASLTVLSRLNPMYFVTSRGDGYYNDPVGMTNRWIENVKREHKNFMPPKVIFNHKKHDVMDEYNLIALIDDNPLFALNVLETNVKRQKPVYVILFDSRWNNLSANDRFALSDKMFEEKKLVIEKLAIYEGITMVRVKNWCEIFKNCP